MLKPPRRYTARFHRNDDEGTRYWGEIDGLGWYGVSDSLDELRYRAREGVTFMLSDAGDVYPPARLVMGWEAKAPSWVRFDPIAYDVLEAA